MITLNDYKSLLSSKGDHLGEVRKNRADMIMNATFTGDIGYRKVYILDPVDGWKYTDAKFSRHSLASTSKDGVDSYLQFRPKEHYPIGCFVFIPDDTSYDLDVNEEDPLYDDAKNLWMIVERTDDRQFVQYLVLKCNWLFKWVVGVGDKKVIEKCWGCVRDAKSYTSCDKYYTARCMGKPYSVFLRICWNPLRAVILKQKNEICLCGKLKK